MSTNNFNNNIITNSNIVNNQYNIKIIKQDRKPKRKSKEEMEKYKKEVQRPYLKHKLGEVVHCYGYIIGRYKNTNRYTVINIVDVKGNYVAEFNIY